MADVIAYRFRLRRALAATWTATNDVLLDGEFGFARDTGQLKIGDGATGWNGLPSIERGLALSLLADVDSSDRADGRALVWDEDTSRHVYASVGGGSGGGGGLDIYGINALRASVPGAGWSWANQNSCTAAMFNTDCLRVTAVTTGSSSNNLSFYYRAPPGSTYTVTACLVLSGISANYSGVALALRNATSGRMEAFSLTSNGSQWDLKSQRYASLTSWNSDITSGYQMSLNVAVPQIIPVWLRMVVGAGSIVGYVSRNGHDWYQLFSDTGGYVASPDQVGIAMWRNPTGSTNSPVVGEVYSWQVA